MSILTLQPPAQLIALDASDDDSASRAMPVRSGWQLSAACAGTETAGWFTDDSIGVQKALELCGQCPVRTDCLAAALAGDEFGIWGGTTRADRNQMRYDVNFGLHQ